MATDSYAILWLGTEYSFTSDDELELVTRREHKLIRKARKVGLEFFCDRFSFTSTGDPSYSLLIGQCLGMAGHKEGITKLLISLPSLPRDAARVRARFERARIRKSALLRLYFHVEFDE